MYHIILYTGHDNNVSIADEHCTWFHRFPQATQQKNGTLPKAVLFLMEM